MEGGKGTLEDLFCVVEVGRYVTKVDIVEFPLEWPVLVFDVKLNEAAILRGAGRLDAAEICVPHPSVCTSG